MKTRVIFVLITVFLVSCEKGETDDTILKFFSEAYKDKGNSIAISSDEQGNDLYYYICGQYTDTLSNNPTLKAGVIKAGQDGNMTGAVTIPGNTESTASKIIVLDDGDIVCTGYIIDSNTSEKNLFVWHLDPGLVTEKLRIYEDADNQYGVDIMETPEGFLVLATTDARREPSGDVTGNPAGKRDILLMRIGSDLEPLTEIPALGYNGNDEGVAVKADRSGGYIIVGTTERSEKPLSEQAGTNLIIIRLNSDGSTTQPRIIGGTASEAASDFEVLNDGYLIAGTTGIAGTTQRGYIWKIPLNIYEAPEYEYEIDIDQVPYSLRAMCRYKTNSFLLAGQHGAGLSARMLIFSIDVYGTPDMDRMKITGGTGTQIANDVAAGDSDDIITVGSSSYENNSMICFLKFRF